MKNKKQIISKCISFMLITSIILSVFNIDSRFSITNVKAESSISNPRIADDGTVTWDIVEFGNYYQDIKSYIKEPIKWRILSISEDGTDALLLSDMVLDVNIYDVSENYDKANWETSYIRNWLNNTEKNDTFIKRAFNQSEIESIITTEVSNKCGLSDGTTKNLITKDKVFLLSFDEIKNSDYGFDKNFKLDATTTTIYANNLCGKTGSNYYWLRTTQEYAGALTSTGGPHYCHEPSGIRPALHLNLKATSQYKDAGEVASDGNVTNKNDGFNNPQKLSDGTVVWDCIYFGNYEQKIEYTRNPIEWRVLNVNGNDAFLLSNKVIDYKKYNDSYTYVTWENCTLRKWLNNNTDGFIKDAFTSIEQSAIIPVTNKNEKNPNYNIDGGKDTVDRVFILSLNEAKNSSYGLDSPYNCNKTEFVRGSKALYAQGLDWWLRTPGEIKEKAMIISAGFLHSNGENVNCFKHVRPAMHVNISTAKLKKTGVVTEKSNLRPTKIENNEVSQKNKLLVSKISAKPINVSSSKDGSIIKISYNSKDKLIDYYYKTADSCYTVKTTYDVVNDSFGRIIVYRLNIPQYDIYNSKFDLSKYSEKSTVDFTDSSGTVFNSSINSELNIYLKNAVSYWLDAAADSLKIDLTQYGFSKMPKSKYLEEKITYKNVGNDVGEISSDGKILKDVSGTKWYMSSKLTKADLKKNLNVAVKNSGKYKITKVVMKNGKVTGGNLEYVAPYSKNAKLVSATGKIKIAGVNFTVTTIGNNAFKNCKKLTKVVIGSGVTNIGKNAFNGALNLKNITVKSKKIKKVGAKAFSGINKKAVITVPKGKKKTYTKLFKKYGLPKTVTVK